MINAVEQRKCVQGYHNYCIGPRGPLTTLIHSLPPRIIARGKLDGDRMFPRLFKNIFSFKLAMFVHFNFVLRSEFSFIFQLLWSMPFNSSLLIFFTIISDHNECRVKNGGCAQACKNLIGNHVCGCRQGYRIASDYHNCTGSFLHFCER